MLKHLNLEQNLTKAEYKLRLPRLRRRLYDLEHAIHEAGIPVMLVFEGWAAAGKGTVINELASEMDARGFRVVPVHSPRTFEQKYPWMRRFWLQIPARGQIVAFDTSWYRRVLIERVTKAVKRRQWQAAYHDIRDFEAMLAADGMLIHKFWLHISRKEQAKRFKKLKADKLTAWQVRDEDAAQHEAYGKYRRAVEEMLAETEAAHAPWTIVEATDREYTGLKVFETIVRVLEHRLGPLAPPPEEEVEAAEAAAETEAETEAKAEDQAEDQAEDETEAEAEDEADDEADDEAEPAADSPVSEAALGANGASQEAAGETEDEDA